MAIPNVRTIGSISPGDVQRLLEEGKALKIIDVREDDEVAEGMIPGAKHIPLGQFPQRLSELGKEDDTVIVCRSGGRSSMACEAAAKAGYKVRNFQGGMLAWHGPVARPGGGS